MSKRKIIPAAILIILAGIYPVYFFGSEHALVAAYPDLDRTKVRKAHRQMCLAALRGEHSNVDMNDDDECERIFFEAYQAL